MNCSLQCSEKLPSEVIGWKGIVSIEGLCVYRAVNKPSCMPVFMP